MHVGMVRPEEFEGVRAFHFLVVLNFDPRLREMGEDSAWGLISEPYVLLVISPSC